MQAGGHRFDPVHLHQNIKIADMGFPVCILNKINVIILILEKRISGGYTGGATPVPIPNTEVKPSMADDTWAAKPWESK